MSYKSKIIRSIFLFLAGCISVFAYSPFKTKFIIVLSLLFLLHVVYHFNSQTTKKTAFFTGFIYGMGFFSSQLYWMFYSLYSVIDTGFIISCIAFIGLMIFLAIYIGLSTLLYNQFKTLSPIFNYLFLFPSLWVLAEWLRGWFLSGFPWSDISYTQVPTQFLRGFYPLIGSYGVSWVIMVCVDSIYVLLINFLENKIPDTKKYIRVAILFLVVIILSGTLLQNKIYTTVYGKPISVALAQGNVAQSAKWSNGDFLTIYQDIIAKAHADLVIIPETAISAFSENLPLGYLAHLTQLAESNNASLIIGIPKIIDDKNNYVNSAVVLTNPDHPYYAKDHLVPYGEYIPAKWLLGSIYSKIGLPMVGYSPGGKNQPPLVAANQKLAFNICYENGFNSELIGSAKNSTIMANLSDMVWYGNTIAKDEHLEISQARALENQRYFIQDTNTGDTAVINPQGEIQSSLPSFKRLVLNDIVYGRVGETPFEKFGNYPIIIWCGLVFLLAVFRAVRK